MSKSGVYVALLRAVNVGGKNRLPMPALRALFEELGCVDVATYIQSGNVVFRREAGMEGFGDLCSRAIGERFLIDVPVVVRSASQLLEIRENNPFPTTDKVHVAFLRKEPSGISSLDPKRFEPDEFRVRGDNLYLFYPNGVGKARLTGAILDKKLGVISTTRNWNTLVKLIELSS